MVRIKIHRGTNQIGGTITEISTETTHIFIDFGSELPGSVSDRTDADMAEMIRNSPCDAVLFSHYHGDHVGLMGRLPEKDTDGKRILLGLGAVAREVLKNIHRTLSNDIVPDAEDHRHLMQILTDEPRWLLYEKNRPFRVGDFTVTPVRGDHSAYDAYMFIIEAEGRTILHTGDFRTHGRFGEKLFPDLRKALQGKTVDILITEGTMLDRRSEKVMTETQLERKAVSLLKKPENKWAFLVCSSTNVESLASFANAAKVLGRPFIVNHYVFEQIQLYQKTAGKEDSRFLFKKTYAFEPMGKANPKLDYMTQPEYMDENGFLMLVGKTDAYQPRMEYFRRRDPLLIYSMWDGYVDPVKYPDTYDPALDGLLRSWRSVRLHTSGHATAEDIEELVKLVSPSQVIPVHTTRRNAFPELDLGSSRAILLEDGQEIFV